MGPRRPQGFSGKMVDRNKYAPVQPCLALLGKRYAKRVSCGRFSERLTHCTERDHRSTQRPVGGKPRLCPIESECVLVHLAHQFDIAFITSVSIAAMGHVEEGWDRRRCFKRASAVHGLVTILIPTRKRWAERWMKNHRSVLMI
ncbi:hypothetical protein AGR3A_Cc420256 [Agrobacterium tomkonis CFBP 6623]|uniref:Uncharacterized protein n=1 Tax=Agrobacterium tomkonis CFBP 6623 TaxID=1183432 RepID=A0A1S7QDX9_9HYPH|nr:hypothetical protein AGR3A_Cc420256 [Agrobacterium tomkonis CFBP 6623]